jgi:hypothetical protein
VTHTSCMPESATSRTCWPWLRVPCRGDELLVTEELDDFRRYPGLSQIGSCTCSLAGDFSRSQGELWVIVYRPRVRAASFTRPSINRPATCIPCAELPPVSLQLSFRPRSSPLRLSKSRKASCTAKRSQASPRRQCHLGLYCGTTGITSCTGISQSNHEVYHEQYTKPEIGLLHSTSRSTHMIRGTSKALNWR